eukprot:g6073.t1
MGKKQHSKDRLYITNKEWKEEWGGNRGRGLIPFSKLPFYCCAITFTPFEDPVCSPDGVIFDIVNAVPFIKKYRKNPVTGESLELRDLTQLHFHKNNQGEYHCPVLNKVFTEHTHIVGIKTTGHVYCYEAVEELNIKPKNWKDLLTEQSFTKTDIIHLQDPLTNRNRLLEDFEHVSKGWNIPKDDERETNESCFRNLSSDTKRVLKTLGTEESKKVFQSGGGSKRDQARQLLAIELTKNQPPSAPQEKKKGVVVIKPGASTWDTRDLTTISEDPKTKKRTRDLDTQEKTIFNKNGAKTNPQTTYAPFVKYKVGLDSTGEMATGLTSTVMPAKTKNPRKLIRVDWSPKKKAYVRLHTSLGHLNLELHSDIVPKTCENFLGLAEMGYYNDTIFHRSVKDFMIQGGDPTGTGRGGESIFGATFDDEFDRRLRHSGRGVVSMANSGAHTNASQFFILFNSAPHLDSKHTVFGKVVGGLETLNAMEAVPTDNDEKPTTEIKLNRISVFVNPYKELMEEEEEKEKEKDIPVEDDPVGSWFSDPALHSKERQGLSSESSSEVGRYLKKKAKKTTKLTAVSETMVDKKKSNEYGDFSSW